MNIENRFHLRSIWQLTWTLYALTACGGRLLVDDESPGAHAHGGAAGADAGAARRGGGGTPENGGASGTSAPRGGRGGDTDAGAVHGAGGTLIVLFDDAGTDALAADSAAGSGGVIGAGGAGGAGGIGASGGAAGADAGTRDASGATGGTHGDGGVTCTFDWDCPPPDRNCAVSRCRAGQCETVNAPIGPSIPDVPADCHASTCDGEGNVIGVIVDQTNAPSPDNPCLVGTCNATGKTGTATLAADTPCSAAPGSVMCDGNGNCVECNHTADCAPGEFCSAEHTCGVAPCTDTDCGGVCPPCDLGKRCLIDADCASYACDAATGKCIQNQCIDHRQDGNETDSDCGGGMCVGCNLGQHCLLDGDCGSAACDTVTLTCISDQCADHRIDGEESDVDCGGLYCPNCVTGKRCRNTGDCLPAHVCTGSVPHVCL